ncbi:tetratricopeptide repeat protein [Pyxidicoccus parkwayensis]|uniref:Tetratricopeptide repeat protein n=1 Tax=Pyxidicoccus parkwayensis TaxID=2813578 RepID=A0ABX7NJW9_9BACT|nr:tetratricopeptide repeat protein [Pyxidicoccus parkwaysis]QSQ18684.1 tetratricopeptide repeat protein [Pyxidicoccus parkwaysis]
MAESSEIANSLVPVDRKQAMVLLEAGYLWLDMGHFDKAREIFAGAAALMPKSEVPQLGLGAVEFAQGRHDKALQAYRSAQRLAPQSALPRAHAGEALLFMGKVPEALKELKAAMDLEPEGDGAKLAQSLIQAKEAGVLPPAKK